MDADEALPNTRAFRVGEFENGPEVLAYLSANAEVLHPDVLFGDRVRVELSARTISPRGGSFIAIGIPAPRLEVAGQSLHRPRGVVRAQA